MRIQTINKFLLYLVIITGFLGSWLFPIKIANFNLFLFRLLIIGSWVFFFLYVFLEDNGNIIISHIKVRKSLLFLLIWFIYALLSILWAIDKSLAIRDLTFLFIALSVIFLSVFFIKTDKDLIRLYGAWLFALFILIGVGYWEFFSGNHLPTSRYFHAVHMRKVFIPTGTFYNPNDYATFLSISFPLLMVQLSFHKKTFLRVLIFFVLVLIAFLVFRTDSRANILALVFETAMFFIIGIKWNNKLIVIFGLIAALLLTNFISATFVEGLFHEVQGTITSIIRQYQNRTGSLAIRMNLFANGFWFLYQTYGFGVGSGNAEYWMATDPKYNTQGFLNLHNWWIEILTNYGLLIFIGYIFLLIIITTNLVRNLKYQDRKKIVTYFPMAFLISWGGFLFASLSSSSLMSQKHHWFLLAISLTYINIKRRVSQ